MRNVHLNLFVGFLLLIAAAAYTSLLPKTKAQSPAKIQQKGWSINVSNDKSTIFDSNGKALGYIIVDNNGKVSLFCEK